MTNRSKRKHHSAQNEDHDSRARRLRADLIRGALSRLRRSNESPETWCHNATSVREFQLASCDLLDKLSPYSASAQKIREGTYSSPAASFSRSTLTLALRGLDPNLPARRSHELSVAIHSAAAHLGCSLAGIHPPATVRSPLELLIATLFEQPHQHSSRGRRRRRKNAKVIWTGQTRKTGSHRSE